MNEKQIQCMTGILGLLLTTGVLVSSVLPQAAAQTSAPSTPFFAVNVDAQPQYVNFLAAFVEPLSEIGIELVVHSTEYAEMSARSKSYGTYANGGWDLWYNLQGAFPVPAPHCAFTYPQAYVKNLDFVPSELKDTIWQAAGESNLTRVEELYQKIQELYVEELPAISVLAAQFPVVFAQNVKNVGTWAKYFPTCLGDRTGILARSTYDQNGGTYVEGQDAYVLSEVWRYPGNFLSIYGWSFIECMYLRLVRMDPDTLEILPELAESWETSSDGKTYTFHLRDGIQWSDGVPLTAEECVWTYQIQMDPKVASSNMKDLKLWIDSLEAPDDKTFVIHLKTPVSFFLTYLAGMYGYQIAPAHVLKDIAPADLKTSDYNTKAGGPVTGWFKVVEHVTGEHTKWERNDLLNTTYFTPHKNKYLIFRTVPDAQAALVAVENKEINSVSPYYNYQNQFPAVRDNAKIQYVNVTSNAIMQLVHNPKHPILSNVWVRKAIANALPINALINLYQYGFGVQVPTLLPPYNPHYNADIEPFSQNLVKAKEYMETAGYKYSYLAQAQDFPYTWVVAGIAGGIVVGAVGSFAAFRLRKK